MSLSRRAAAECLGTFLLVWVGVGAAVFDHLHGGLGPVGVSLAFTFAVASAVYAFGPGSGAHINPAVTIGLTVRGGFPARDVPAYVVAQLVGAVAASAALAVVFGDAVSAGATVPRIPVLQAFGIEVLLSVFLVVVIFAVVDENGARGAGALAIGIAVGMDSLAGGGLTGASMNPARSIGPALVSGAWTAHWLYWVAPITGMIAAAAGWRWLVSDSGGRE